MKEQYRRQGHGEALLKAAIEKCRARKVSRIVLHVDPTRMPALTLYRKQGFQVDTLIEGYYSSDRNAYRMYLDLDANWSSAWTSTTYCSFYLLCCYSLRTGLLMISCFTLKKWLYRFLVLRELLPFWHLSFVLFMVPKFIAWIAQSVCNAKWLAFICSVVVKTGLLMISCFALKKWLYHFLVLREYTIDIKKFPFLAFFKSCS